MSPTGVPARTPDLASEPSRTPAAFGCNGDNTTPYDDPKPNDGPRLPESFLPAAASLCFDQQRPYPGDGVWVVTVEQRLQGDLQPLRQALLRPDTPAPSATPGMTVACAATLVIRPTLSLVSSAGRSCRPGRRSTSATTSCPPSTTLSSSCAASLSAWSSRTGSRPKPRSTPPQGGRPRMHAADQGRLQPWFGPVPPEPGRHARVPRDNADPLPLPRRPGQSTGGDLRRRSAAHAGPDPAPARRNQLARPAGGCAGRTRGRGAGTPTATLPVAIELGGCSRVARGWQGRTSAGKANPGVVNALVRPA